MMLNLQIDSLSIITMGIGNEASTFCCISSLVLQCSKVPIGLLLQKVILNSISCSLGGKKKVVDYPSLPFCDCECDKKSKLSPDPSLSSRRVNL